MIHKKSIFEKPLYCAYLGIILLFLGGFVWINLNPEQWYNYDIYADAMIAKHMVQARSLFPSDWTYGNQLYVVATPVVSAVFYALCGNTVLSLGLASCLMTGITVLCFLWCLEPFTGKRGRIIGLLCLVGGTLFGTTASSDPTGLQVFFTMASYYSCYVIGILFTLGVWLRILYGKKLPKVLVLLALVGNLLLSMQSLRELLVLNLPLLAASVLCFLLQREQRPSIYRHKGSLFALSALGAGFCGVLLVKVLGVLLPIDQIDVLTSPKEGLLAGVKDNIKVLAQYMGLQKPVGGIGWWKLLSGIFCLLLTVLCTIDALKQKKLPPLGAMLLYGWISMGAVFCAGVLFVGTRPIYYFPWHLLVSFSGAYLGEKAFSKLWKKQLLLLVILVISASSLYYNYRLDIGRFRSREENCKETTNLLLERGITHVYYDGQWNFYGPQIAAYSGDKVTTAAFFLNPGGLASGDLLKHTDYLASDRWYDEKKLPSSYLLLSEKSLAAMDEAYKEALLSHLELQAQCSHLGVEFYFYSLDEILFRDLNNED